MKKFLQYFPKSQRAALACLFGLLFGEMGPVFLFFCFSGAFSAAALCQPPEPRAKGGVTQALLRRLGLICAVSKSRVKHTLGCDAGCCSGSSRACGKAENCFSRSSCAGNSRRKREFAAIVLRDNIIVEEIDVEGGLDSAGYIYKPVMAIKWFIIRTVDPIEDIKEPIRAKEKDVMSCQIFDLTVALENKELWYDGQRFEEYRECP